MHAKTRFLVLFLMAAVFIGTTGFIASSRYNASLKKSATGPNKELTENGRNLIQHQLVDPLKEKLNDTRDARIMSRCPSGVRYYMEDMATSQEPYFFGTVYNYTGCEGTVVCNFRLSQDETVLEAAAPVSKEGAKLQYKPVDEFLKNLSLKGQRKS